MNICEHLTATAKLFPEKEAMVFEGRRFTFTELEELSRAAAGLLTAAEIVRGDRVALMLPNVPAFVVWYYAALRVGAIAVSISTRSAASEVSFLVADCNACVFVTLPDSLEAVKNEFPECVEKCFSVSELGDLSDGEPIERTKIADASWINTDPDEAALILYTSGTTGFPKGSTLSHMNVRSNVHAFNHLCNMQPHDRILLAVPLFHCFGQNALLNAAFNAGATLVLQRAFDPTESKRLIADEQVTQLYGVPMMFQLFHDSCDPSDLASVNYCFSAAAKLPIQTGHRWQEKFSMPIFEGYGLTETSPFASYNHRTNFVPGSIGMPIDCVEMKIVDTETDRDCPPGELGEIVVRGPNVMLGYWNRPADTAEAIRDGWFHSGDIGRMDDQGFFYIVDRVKDMISVGGLKVYPAEVERVLLDHPAVLQVAVVGFPDEVFGEKVVAFIVPKTPETIDHATNEILQHAKNNLANFKVPRALSLIDELPRNASGKILKTTLREMKLTTVMLDSGSNNQLNSGVEGIESSPGKERRAPTLRKELASTYEAGRIEVANSFVQNLVQAISGSSDIPDSQTRFLDAGLDSLMIVEMSSQIQIEIGPAREIPATLVFDYPRICDLGEFLVQVLTPSAPSKDAQRLPTMESTPPPRDNMANQHEIANMTEQEALEELMKELEAQ